jgi:acetolactate synthase-1/2/3 large subunit
MTGPPPRGMTGAAALLRALRAMGVERVYASPGSEWAPLWEALAGPDAERDFPRYVSVRHEEAAVAMAMGYAKATAGLPAVVLHTTVGALHAAMPVRNALHERIPMVVLAGGSIAFAEDRRAPVGRQWLRLLTDLGGPARFIEPCVKWSVAVETPIVLPRTIRRACQLAVAPPRGPVFVGVPMEHLLHHVDDIGPPAALPMPAAASADAIDALAAALNAARNPVIVTEEAGRDVRAVAQLVTIAETLGAPVFEAWQPYYVNFPRDHPLWGGVAADEMPALLADADLVFLVDCVAPWHPPSRIADKAVLALGEDPLHSRLPFWGFRADVVAAGDVARSLARLGERLERRASRPDWPARLAERRATALAAARDAGRASVVDDAWVAHELNETLPADAVVVNETITHRLALHRQLTRLRPGGFYETSYGGLGLGLGVALGVKHAMPDRPVVCTIGDGAFHYNPVVAAFGAAQELALPLLVVLFDNGGYLSQKRDVVESFPRGAAVTHQRFVGTAITPRPDYVALARAFGGAGERVEKPADVRGALARGLEAVAGGRLALVHLVLPPVQPV